MASEDITVKQLIAELQKLVAEHPEVNEMVVIYASDDEGNNYQTVSNTPTIACVDDLKQRSLDLMGEFGEDTTVEGIVTIEECNAVIIN